jgi:hypothetical protein
MGSKALFLEAFPSPDLRPRTMGDPKPAVPVHALRKLSRAFSMVESVRGRTPLTKPSLISTYEGAIKTLLLSIPSYVHDDPAYEIGYTSLLATLPVGTTFVVVHHVSSASKTKAMFLAAKHDPNCTYVPMPDHVNFTVWAEDAYVGATDELSGDTYLLEPLEFLRSGDALIADYVEDNTTVRNLQTPLIFQGGNCLVGDDFWLMGMDYALDTINRSAQYGAIDPEGKTLDQLLDWVKSMFKKHVDAKRELHLVGTKKHLPDRRRPVATKEGNDVILDFAYDGIGDGQPIFHIDMFVSLLGRIAGGKFLIAVGSPKLASQALGQPQYKYGLDEAFDDIADDLQARGFAVDRVPLPLANRSGRDVSLAGIEKAYSDDPELARALVAELRGLSAKDSTKIKTRHWYFATASNCLVQRSASAGDAVWLPTYGHGNNAALATIDNEVAKFWKSHNFSVNLLGDFHAFAQALGAVHCIKKYLEREA